MAASVPAGGVAMAAGAVATGGAVNSLSHCLAVLRLHPHRRAAPDMVDAISGFCWNWTNASALVSRRRARTLMERGSAAGRLRLVLLWDDIDHYQPASRSRA